MNFKPLYKDELHFTLFLEVLDNMPHDRVYFDKNKNGL